jgi:hypothetical protein
MVGNKGAVAVAFNINFTSIIFINCHLAAGQNNSSKRNKDFERINSELRLDNLQFIEGKLIFLSREDTNRSIRRSYLVRRFQL